MFEVNQVKCIGLAKEPIEEQTRNKINELYNSSPSDANATVQLRKTRLGYRGILKIISSQGVFKAKAYHQNMNEVFRMLFTNIGDQLDQWKTQRRFDEVTSLIP